MDVNKYFFKYIVYLLVCFLRGQKVLPYRQSLLRSERLDASALASLQLNKLQRIVTHAIESVPFFTNALAHTPEITIRSLADLSKLPYTTKADLKGHREAMLSSNRYYLLTKKTTGGSTGEPVTIPKTRDAMAWELAATWRGYSWAGIDIGDRQGRLWGVPFGRRDRNKAKLIDFVANRKRCSAFSFGEKDLDAYTAVLQKFEPKYLYGYVSMIEEYAKYFRRKDISPPFSLRCVITTSEVLTDYHRKLIEETFSTKVYNEYGSGELGSVAHECEEGSMHISAENLIVEVIDGHRPCKPGEVGELVITELNNFAAPLIRYRTGDFASLSPSSCKCGRTLPVIDNLYGRAYDTLKNAHGKLFHGEFVMYIFEEAQRRNLGIRAFQAIQLDLQRFRFKIVPDAGYGKETEQFITDHFIEKFDKNTILEFERVDRIERAASGKMRLIIGMNEN